MTVIFSCGPYNIGGGGFEIFKSKSTIFKSKTLHLRLGQVSYICSTGRKMKISSGVIGPRNLESGFESESESTLFFLNPNPDSYILALNPNPDPNPTQKALNPDSNPNPDSDSHITGWDV